MEIPITPSLCDNIMPYWYKGYTQKITKKESPVVEIENLKQQHWHHQDNTGRSASP
jgi:hypothetical protein